MTIAKNDATWMTVAGWAKAEIDAARDSLENGVGSADHHRGRISALRDLLKLPDGTKQPNIPDPPTY